MQNSKRSKIHHFIPRGMQRQFCDPLGSEKIWYSERDDNGRYFKPEYRNIASTFKEKNFYTITHKGEKSDIVEREFYGPLDDSIAKFIKEILAVFHRGSVPVLGGESLNSVRHMIMAMIKRTPHFVKKYDGEKVGHEVISNLLAEERSNLSNEQIFQLEGELKNPALLAELGRDARVRATISKMEKTDHILEEFSIRWVRPQHRSSFILSDLGVVRIGNGGSNGLSNPNAEAWMPLTPHLVAVMVRDPENKLPLLSEFNQKSVRDVNSHLVEEGKAIASPSRKLLEALIARDKGK